MDVSRQHFQRPQQLPAFKGAPHDETLVQAHQVGHERPFQQVVADGYLLGGVAAAMKHVVHQSRVQGDVPVVAHKHIVAPGRQPVEPGTAEAGGGLGDHPVYIFGDDHLHGLHILHPLQLPPQPEGGDEAHQRPR